MSALLQRKGFRLGLWVIGGLLLAGIAAVVALQVAIARNGPAVLDTVDRIAGGTREAEQLRIVSTGAHEQQKLVVWGPARSGEPREPLPVILFVHGGSWADGDPVDYGFVARNLVREGFVVVLSGYRLNGSGRYPAMLEDTASAIAWTREEIAGFGGDPSRIVLAGHSAGAYNVVMAALEERWLARHDIEANEIAGVVALAAPVDFVPFDSESTIASFGHVENPEATQPLTHIRGDAPPMLLVHGAADTTVRIRNSRLLADALAKANSPVHALYLEEMTHGDPLYALAAPWRSRASHSVVAEAMIAFARDPQGFTIQLSVPVQPETR